MRPCNQGKTRIARRKPLCRQRQCGEQQESVAEMQTQKDSVSGGSVQASNAVDQDQQCAKQGFVEQKRCCRCGRIARPVALYGASPAPNQKKHHKQERNSASHSVVNSITV